MYSDKTQCKNTNKNSEKNNNKKLQASPVLNGHNKTLRFMTIVNIYKQDISVYSNNKTL